MKALPPSPKSNQALTLVESLLLLLALFIFFVLVAMLLPARSHSGPLHGRQQARLEINNLMNAIQAYEVEYHHLPLAQDPTNEDITFGIRPDDIKGFQKIRGTSLVETNSDLIVALMDLDSGANSKHKLNPKQVTYLYARMTSDTKSPGVGVDHQYRDPWGNPFVISLDANHDGYVCDAFYSCPNLFSANATNALLRTNGIYELRGNVMVWSRGPDGKASFTVPAKSGVNKDNVLSWE